MWPSRTSEYRKAYYRAHPEMREKSRLWSQNRRKDKAWHAKRLVKMREYGRLCDFQITPEVFERMKKDQHDLCAICAESFLKTPLVDHAHACCPGRKSCGKCVRELLCARCNTGLGYLENPLWLETAKQYLAIHAEKGNGGSR